MCGCACVRGTGRSRDVACCERAGHCSGGARGSHPLGQRLALPERRLARPPTPTPSLARSHLHRDDAKRAAGHLRDREHQVRQRRKEGHHGLQKCGRARHSAARQRRCDSSETGGRARCRARASRSPLRRRVLRHTHRDVVKDARVTRARAVAGPAGRRVRARWRGESVAPVVVGVCEAGRERRARLAQT